MSQDASLPTTLSARGAVESWYLAYALAGAVVAGLGPILLPLKVAQIGTVTEVGLVMGAVSLGGLSAPLWGTLVDRYRIHRLVLAGGLVAIGVGLGAFTLSASLVVWLGLALINGAGAAAASTVANLFIVERHPQKEWDKRIGWLQTFYGGGQVAGLLAAGLFGGSSVNLGLATGAGICLVGLVPSLLAPVLPKTPQARRTVLLHPAHSGEWAARSPQSIYHHLTWQTARQLGRYVDTPFAQFLIAWLLSFGGAAAVFSLYPVLMQHAYGVSPAQSSAAFAIAAALGLGLYLPASRLSEHLGPETIFRAALVVRLAAFIGLVLTGYSGITSRHWLALLSMVFVVLAWSLLSVSSTSLVARLSAANQGEGMGVFNATTGVAGVLGAALAGVVASQWGYVAVSELATVGVIISLVLSFAVPRPGEHTARPLVTEA